MNPYDELWADLVAVVYLHDPMAMAKGINFSLSKETENERSFNRKTFLEDSSQETGKRPFKIKSRIFDRLGEAYAQSIIYTRWSRDPEFDPYAILDPVKYHIWTQYLNHSFYKDNPRKILFLIAKALDQEIQVYGENPELSTISPREMNERLIQRIDEIIHKEFNEN